MGRQADLENLLSKIEMPLLFQASRYREVVDESAIEVCVLSAKVALAGPMIGASTDLMHEGKKDKETTFTEQRS